MSLQEEHQKEKTVQNTNDDRIYTGFLPNGDFYVGTELPAGGFATDAGEADCCSADGSSATGRKFSIRKRICETCGTEYDDDGQNDGPSNGCCSGACYDRSRN